MRNRFYVNKTIFCQYHSNNNEERAKNCCESGLGIANHLSQRKEE